MKTELFRIDRPEGHQTEIARAAAILTGGGLLAIPTETVYGLGANGLDAAAVGRIFAAKGRPQDNPLILHVPDASWLGRCCRDVPETAYRLAERFWPGPLTLILPRAACVPDRTTGGLDTVGVRCPDHPVTRAILLAADVPVAAPSANLSGRPSCTTARHVLEDMDGKIEGIVDGGPCAVGVESTILDLTCTPPRLLRPGGLPLEALRAVLGEVAVDKAVTARLPDGERPRAPGMKYRHYAPKAPVTVVTGDGAKSAGYIARRALPGDGVICFDEYAGLFRGCTVERLGPAGDKAAQARRVFDALRAFDATDAGRIYAQCPDPSGLGLAVGNRLKKAAGFHVVALPEAGRFVVGFTGPTGAGKTSVLRAWEQMGAYGIDCDALYTEMLQSDTALQTSVLNEFGPDYLTNGVLDRQKLGALVFRDADALRRLNAIAFDAVPREVLRRLSGRKETRIGIDAVNLLSCELLDFCDLTVAVTAPEPVRLRRIMERDGIDEAAARLRMAAQPPDGYYIERCDAHFDNDAPTEAEAEARAKNKLGEWLAGKGGSDT